MSVIVKVLVPSLQMQAVQTTQYSPGPGISAIIDKATVTNTDTVARTFSANIVPSGQSVGNANLIIDDRAVQPGDRGGAAAADAAAAGRPRCSKRERDARSERG
jgi:hypothetical protein